MNHKRRRPKYQRAGCDCGHKEAKNRRATRKSLTGRGMKLYGGSGRERRLATRMKDDIAA